jgi:hypothetical protein
MLNLYRHYSGTVYCYMWTAARAYNPESYKFFMDKIHAENSDFSIYLERNHSLLWMMSAFNPAIKCDYINNNLLKP